MTRREPLPADWRELPFSRGAARLRGVSDGRLRASDLSHPFHGVRQPPGTPADIQWLCRAYLERMPRHCAFSHVTAAQLYGLPLPQYADHSALHVAVPAGQRPPEGRGVAGHEVGSAYWDVRDVVYLDPQRDHMFAFPTVTPALLWAQLASVLDVDDLVAVGDAIVGGKPALASIQELRDLAKRWGRRRGARLMTIAIEQIRVGSLSRPESLQRLQLVRAGIPEPELNVRVEDQRGKLISMADIVWRRYRTVLEYEGDGHRTSRTTFRSDVTRGENYADGGWFPMRSHADDVFGDPNDLIRRVARRLRAQGWESRRELRQVAAARR